MREHVRTVHENVGKRKRDGGGDSAHRLEEDEEEISEGDGAEGRSMKKSRDVNIYV
jgi:hypothetical protein